MSGFDAFRSERDQLPATLVGTPRAAMITVDEAGTVTGWSPGAHLLLGYLAGQVVGQPVARILASGDRVLSAVRDGWSGELTVRHADHRLLTLPAQAYALSHRGDRQWLLMVTEPEESFASQNGQAMLDWLFSGSPIALAVYDTHMRWVWQNTAMNRMIGTSQQERRVRQPQDVLTGPDVDHLERHLREAMDTGFATAAFTIRGRTPADPDHDHIFSATASPLRGRAGQSLGVCATAHDVTKQHRYRERLAILNEASMHIGSTLDLRGTAQELADVAVPRLADFISVDLLEPLLHGDEPGPVTAGARLRRMAHRSVNEGAPESLAEVGEVDVYPGQTPPARCLASGRPLLLRAMDSNVVQWFANDPARAETSERYGFHSWLFVPVCARGVTLGVTVFCRSWPNEPFEQEDLVLAEELVTRAAVCLDNARRFTREHTAALALQRSLLPKQLPWRPSLEAAFRYLPASSEFGVGGDWFDVIALSGARLALVVGDVVGHGIHAAATMGGLRTAVRTLADVDLPPDELLTHLDDLVTHHDAVEVADPGEARTSDTTATCMYVVYNPITRNCSFACAGHPPPVVLTPDGTIVFPHVDPGPPLGLGGLPFETSQLELPDGSEIVLYTDGLISSRDGDIDEGLEQLGRALARPAASLAERCDAVLDALLPEHPTDDVALLIARTHALHEDRVAIMDVPADPAVVADTRSWASRRLETWGLEGMGFVTELVVSELVTNAIRYGAPPIQLRLIKDTALICEVSDASSTAPHMRRTRVFDEGGRGLLLVAQLTRRWGTRHSREGKTIWCEQPLAEDHPTTM
jgi:PAS domain S-box-containing protein